MRHEIADANLSWLSNEADAIRKIMGFIARDLGVSAEDIDIHAPVTSYGYDSAKAVAFAGMLGEIVGRSLPATLLFDCPTVYDLAKRLVAWNAGDVFVEQHTEIEDIPGACDNTSNDKIAIIGIGCRLPGNIHSAKDFWNLLRTQADAVGSIPTSRPELLKQLAGTSQQIQQGGWLEDINNFDMKFFGVHEHEAASMDPQQFIALETAWHALEDAGIITGEEPQNIGVFVGASNSDFAHMTVQVCNFPELTFL